MSTLPTELDDLIVDHLRDNKHALIACALVNKSWLLSSRHRLFEKVILVDDNSKTFLELAASPLATFLSCIRSLIDMHSKFFADLLPRLPIFPSLKDLHLHYIDVNGVSEIALTQLGAVFPHVTELNVSNTVRFCRLHDLFIIVARFLQLRRLSIKCSFLQEDVDAISHHPPVPPALEVVRVHSKPGSDDPFPHIAAWLGAAQGPSAIRALELGLLKRQSLPSVGNLVRMLGPDLHALSLNLMYQITTADIETHLDLSRNINLQDLTVHVGLRRLHSPSAHPHATWALLAAPQLSQIKSLTIVLQIDLIHAVDIFDWARLNTMLGSAPHFSALQRLRFLVHCPSDHVAGAIIAQVPMWAEKGIVEVQVTRSGKGFTL
ncbi:hypothetical protein DFH08DRAFT_403306 [Mycena albidolilacea]|uniref:Uncharacterized protein n=1 Tax=Mycena albidolilacea TaxID=1033008 RepID=A0AAD7EYA5_9AGAR|nr:hypothetical protein DFH08DRAFT_403306 [Mycena albidolilacea]